MGVTVGQVVHYIAYNRIHLAGIVIGVECEEIEKVGNFYSDAMKALQGKDIDEKV